MRTFRVYFNDGNQKLFVTLHMGAVVRYIEENLVDGYSVMDITKIEEVGSE